MTEYEKQIFRGKCPYTDLPCDDTSIDCYDCEVEKAERKLNDILDMAEKEEGE